MLRRLAFAALPLCAAALTVSVAAQETLNIRLGTVAPTGTPWEAQMKKTKAYLEQAEPRIKLKTFFGGAKGDEKSLVRQCKDGRMEMIGVSTSALATEVPALEVLELPFLFESSAEADFVLDNYLKEPVSQIMRKNGFVLYQWAENGWQNFGTQYGFVKSPADLKGHKIRSQESQVHIATWKAFGASPVEMAVSEVLPALKTGLVEGFGQTPLFTFATGWHQGVQYYTVSRHVYQPAVIVYSAKWFDAQPAELQTKLLGDAEAQTRFSRDGVRKIEDGLLQNFVNYGIKVHELTAAERQSFAKQAEALHDGFTKKASKDAKAVWAKIREGKQAYRAQKK